jgi:GT2 family glycosyltransferase/predicted SAM-dependent methyltransferase
MDPKVCVLILNLNGRQHLEYCLPSVARTEYSNLELVLIDNNSTDDSVSFTRAHFPQVSILQNSTNLGWAGGNNAGIRYALERGTDHIVLLNNDIEVDERWLREAVRVAEQRPRVGLIGFNTVGEYKNSEDPERRRFNELRAAWRELKVNPTDHITGCALFVRAEVFRNVGLIDESYFAYGEEDDLESRAIRAGYARVRINVPVWHYNGGFWGKRFMRSSYLAMRNNVRYLLKTQTPREIIRQTIWLIRFVCSFRMQFDHDIPHFRRLRPSRYIVNVSLLAVAFLWNLVFLPVTLWKRAGDERKIKAARRVLDARCPPSPVQGNVKMSSWAQRIDKAKQYLARGDIAGLLIEILQLWKWKRGGSRVDPARLDPHRFDHLPLDDRKLHVGCGQNYLPGWINIDLNPSSKADLVWDVTQRLAFDDNSISLIHSEDFIEHISLEAGKNFFRECLRILRPGGVMRVLTPNLLVFARCYLERDAGSMKWYADNFGVRTYAEMFNFGMRMGGHTFLYDEETLDMVLREVGFEVIPTSFNQSCHPSLCNLDIRGDGLSIYRDCRKTVGSEPSKQNTGSAVRTVE